MPITRPLSKNQFEDGSYTGMAGMEYMAHPTFAQAGTLHSPRFYFY